MKKKIVKIALILELLVIITGFYFSFIKAGIPYQDPTLEMIKKYDFYMNTGKVLLAMGITTLFITIISLCVVKSKKNRK